MLGKIVEVPEVLFRLRRHSSNSWNGTVTPVQVLQWHNPRASRLERLIPFRVAIVFEHMKSVSYLPLSPIQKVTCMPIACLTPLARNVWVWFLRTTGPIRRKLRAITGWKALHPSHVTG